MNDFHKKKKSDLNICPDSECTTTPSSLALKHSYCWNSCPCLHLNLSLFILVLNVTIILQSVVESSSLAEFCLPIKSP